MNTITTIVAWRSLILHFLSNFTIPGGKIFVQLLNRWILCTVWRTVTGILPFADPDGQHAYDAFHRFFPNARWSMAGLWRMLAQIMIKTFYRTPTITLALDDTLFHLKSRPSFADAIACLRRELWHERIKCVTL